MAPGCRPFAKLHLAYLTFIAGQEDAALAHLKEHLSWCVQRGRDTCAGCGQTRGEDTPMPTSDYAVQELGQHQQQGPGELRGRDG